jgi:glycerol kinase
LILLKLCLNDFTDLLIGTVDTWLMWNLTGGIDGGVYITDVTNARWSSFVIIWLPFDSRDSIYLK